MDPALLGLGREALLLALWISAPPLAAALLVGLVALAVVPSRSSLGGAEVAE